MKTIVERVAAGAAWLDTNRPGWWEDVDLRSLDLDSPCKCILGQTDGSYWHVVDQDFNSSSRRAASLGFTTDPLTYDDETSQEELAALEAEWRRVVTGRRAAAE